MRRTCELVSPPGSAPRPSTSWLLSLVSTSKWIATRVQPVPASQFPQRLGRLSQVVRAEGADPPVGHIGDVVVGPGVQPDQGDPVGRDDGRQQFLDVRVPVPGQRRHRHGLEPRVLAGVPTSGSESIQTMARSSP